MLFPSIPVTHLFFRSFTRVIYHSIYNDRLDTPTGCSVFPFPSTSKCMGPSVSSVPRTCGCGQAELGELAGGRVKTGRRDGMLNGWWVVTSPICGCLYACYVLMKEQFLGMGISEAKYEEVLKVYLNLTWPSRRTFSTFGDDEYLVGKISRSNIYFRVHWLHEYMFAC